MFRTLISTFPILSTLTDTWEIQELDLGTFVSDDQTLWSE